MPGNRLGLLWIGAWIGVIALIAGVMPRVGEAIGRDQAAARQAALPYVPGRIIVKYKDSFTESPYLLLRAGKTFHHAARHRDGAPDHSLDRLHAKYRVRSMKPVFHTEADEARARGPDTAEALRRLHAARLADSKRRFAKRSRRAPRHAVAPDLSRVYVLELPAETDIERAVAELTSDPHVEYAQPDYVRQADATVNDPYYRSAGSWGQAYDDLWGLKSIQAGQAWDLAQGEGVVVAVVDTGVDYTHPDLAANIVPGKDMTTCAEFGPPLGACIRTKERGDDPRDEVGHGTVVAGIIGALGNNGIGIVGVAPKAKIMPIKGMNFQAVGLEQDLAAGIVYAASHGADVISNSWGCERARCPTRPVVEEAVKTAISLGAVVVFSAGNDAEDVAFDSPKDMPEIITVGATNQLDQLTDISSFGLGADVVAPGGDSGYFGGSCANLAAVNILSLKAQGTDYLKYEACYQPYAAALPSGDPASRYYRLYGTSTSAPYVAGVAALVLSARPTLTAEEVQQVIRASADDLAAPGFDARTGAGRINAYRALQIGVPLQVKVTSPAFRSVVDAKRSALDILGTAAGPGFQQYQLFYGKGLAPETWTAITPSRTSPVQHGILGTWDLRGLALGDYVLRLVARSQAGYHFYEHVRVHLEPTSRQITASLNNQYDPAVAGHLIVWRDIRNGNNDIYLYDLSRNEELPLVTEPSSQEYPAVSGNRIVWADKRSGNLDIYTCVYAPATGACPAIPVVTASGTQIYPAVSGDGIVWESTSEIYYRNMSTGATWSTVGKPGRKSFPAISGNRIVWTDDRNGNDDIYLYDLGTRQEVRVTAHPARQMMPAISGDKIVWQDQRNGNADIYLYDLAARQESAVVTHPAQQSMPDISGSRVVWQDQRNGNEDIYLYDLARRAEQQLTSNYDTTCVNKVDQQIEPRVSEGRIVWTDHRNSLVTTCSNQESFLYNSDIYAHHDGAAPALTIAKSPTGPWTTNTLTFGYGEKIYLNLTEASPEQPVAFHWSDKNGVWYEPTTLNNEATGAPYDSEGGSVVVGPLPNAKGIPLSWSVGKNYRIEVIVDGVWSNQLTYAVDRPITVMVVDPNEYGVKLSPGQTYRLWWQQTGYPQAFSLWLLDALQNAVNVDGPNGSIASNVMSTGSSFQSYDWKIPSYVSSGDYYLQVSAESAGGSYAVDESDAPFTVQAPFINVYKPDSTTAAQAGQSLGISWEAAGMQSNSTLSFQLRHPDGHLESIGQPVGTAMRSTSVTLPSALAASNAYRIMVMGTTITNRDLGAFSQAFTVTAAVPAPTPALKLGRSLTGGWTTSNLAFLKGGAKIYFQITQALSNTPIYFRWTNSLGTTWYDPRTLTNPATGQPYTTGGTGTAVVVGPFPDAKGIPWTWPVGASYKMEVLVGGATSNRLAYTVQAPAPSLQISKYAVGPWGTTGTFSKTAQDKIYMRIAQSTPNHPILFQWSNSTGTTWYAAQTLTNPATGQAYVINEATQDVVVGPFPNGSTGVKDWASGTNYKIKVQVDGAWSTVRTYSVR